MKKLSSPRSRLAVLFVFVFALSIQFCSPTQNQVTPQEYKMPVGGVDSHVSYSDHIKPMLENSCTPCHYPEKGKKKLLNTYEAVAEDIDEIIYRVQLPSDSSEFMPYKSKKLPLSAVEIQVLKNWNDQGLGR